MATVRSPSIAGAARRDLALLVLLAAVSATVCARLNVSEELFRWTRPLERFQVDELPVVLLVIAIGLIWFSARRYREMQRELARRRAAEEQLGAVLSQNRELTRQYVQAQEAERQALARDLHDELGQYLNVVKLDAVSIRQRSAQHQPLIRAAADGMIRNIDHVLQAIYGLIRQLRPVALDELGLAAALEQCVGDWRRRLPAATLGLSMNGRFEALAEPAALALLRLVQEALTNIARHARATRVDIRIEHAEATERAEPAAGFLIEIADDGVGSDLRAPTRGLGLVGMRERLAGVGGSLTLRSEPGRGFTVRGFLPSAPQAAAPVAAWA
ncbi:MAG TPA: ATP-binding protein [Steroidobacteraceae bacterium]|jgi:signal transduction histidine kinase|nr:ATP-binding protein [Steroidobacteraceae bacterium]